MNDTCLIRLVFNVFFFKVERRIDLVYGGGSVGLMGLVSQAVHDGGRHVLGFVLTHSPFSVVHVIYIIGHLNHFC